MKLFYRDLGKGQPLVIIHGLYGSSDNWLSVAGYFKDNFRIIIPDVRNHGQSPHSNEMSFRDMANDVYGIIRELEFRNIFLLGHSMGGKIAMWLSFMYPALIKKLVVVDVAPKSYLTEYSKHFEFHKNIILALKELKISDLRSRSEAESILADKIKSERIVRFLLKNLKKNTDNSFRWILNLDSIHRHLFKIIDGFSETDFSFNTPSLVPSLFIKGEKSDYLTYEDKNLIAKYYTDFLFVTIPDSGHWVHAEQTGLFAETVKKFIVQ